MNVEMRENARALAVAVLLLFGVTDAISAIWHAPALRPLVLQGLLAASICELLVSGFLLRSKASIACIVISIFGLALSGGLAAYHVWGFKEPDWIGLLVRLAVLAAFMLAVGLTVVSKREVY